MVTGGELYQNLLDEDCEQCSVLRVRYNPTFRSRSVLPYETPISHLDLDIGVAKSHVQDSSRRQLSASARAGLVSFLGVFVCSYYYKAGLTVVNSRLLNYEIEKSGLLLFHENTVKTNFFFCYFIVNC